MKKLILLFIFVFGSFAVQAQDSLEWHTDLQEAMTLSQKSKKPLLMFFTGSDWCGWCIRLQKEVLKTPEFAAWAKDNVILLELDFPKRTPQDLAVKQQNSQLAQFFKVRGYPTVWFATATKTAEGKISFDAMGSTGYVAGGPDAWLKGANDIINRKKT